MIYCLFLIYEPVALDKSLLRLNRLLTMGGRKAQIIVINNGPQRQHVNRENVELIQGDNRCFEFSGWEAGKQYIEKHYCLKSDDTFCFVNDTFDKNHYFSWLTVLLYHRKLKQAVKQYQGFILGRVDTRNIEYKVDHLPFTEWVSSYFFIVDYSAYQALVFTNPRLTDAVTEVTDESINFDSSVVDSAMQKHINGWLRPEGKGWYRAHTSNNEVIKNKSIAILHEKYLTATLKAKEIALIHVYRGRFGRLVRKFDKRIQDYRIAIRG